LKDVRDVAQRLNTPEATRELERAQTDWACRRAEVCRARIGRDPASAHLRVVLAEALRDLGEYPEAIASAQQASTCDSESPLAYWIIGQCHYALGDSLQALTAWRHAALRRAVPAPAKLRVAALKAACEQAERLGLSGSLPLYQQALQLAELEAAQHQDRQPIAAPMMIEAPPNPPPANKRT
jgi:tetratricopeptide (TPR) repeat protein